MSAPVLAVERLGVAFGAAQAVEEVSFDLYPGRTLAVLGESGSGKSVTARAVLGVLPAPGRVTGGQVRLEGEDLLTASAARRRAVRGARIAMIFQDAQSALNPVLPVGYQVTEALRARTGLSRVVARERAVTLLDRVGIPAAARRVGHYPHQFSGGMRQRVMIAMALSQDPAVLIADEPTTALDVTVQAQILDLLLDLRDDRGAALLFITHDMGVVATVADDVLVMYGGRGVESGPAARVLAGPRHPYTGALLASVPRREHRGRDLPVIGGHPPALGRTPTGCVFRERCAAATARCEQPPPRDEPVAGHVAFCHHPGADGTWGERPPGLDVTGPDDTDRGGVGRDGTGQDGTGQDGTGQDGTDQDGVGQEVHREH